MSPQIRHELYATLVGLLTVGAGLWLRAPAIFLVVLALGAYAGTKLLLSPIPKQTVSAPEAKPSAKTRPAPASASTYPALPVDTENLRAQIDEVSAQLAREVPRIKEIKVARKLKRILELGQHSTTKLAPEGGYTHLRSIHKLFVSLEMLLRKYLALSSRTVVDSKLTRTRRDFQLLLYKIEDALETYSQEGARAEVQNFSVDLRVVEEDIDALHEKR